MRYFLKQKLFLALLVLGVLVMASPVLAVGISVGYPSPIPLLAGENLYYGASTGSLGNLILLQVNSVTKFSVDPTGAISLYGDIKPGGAICGNNQILQKNSIGTNWICATLPLVTGDNLGNHTAIQVLSMGNFKITNLATPTLATDAATMAYVDAKPGDNLGNHTATQVLSMGNFKITNLATPTLATDAATMAYVDTAVANSGWADNGTVVRLITATDNVGIGTASAARKLSILDGASGPIVSLSGLTTNYRGLSLRRSSDDAENWFTGANNSNNFVIRRNGATDDLTIDTTGALSIYGDIKPGGASCANNQILQKIAGVWVCASVTGDNLGNHTATANLNMNTAYKITNLATPVAPADATTKAYVDARPGDNLGNHTATQVLSIGNFKITNLATPTLATDATTKAYVDTAVSGVANSGWTDDGSAVRLTTIGDNVGIGTNVPSARLEVANATTRTTLRISNSNTGASGSNGDANLELINSIRSWTVQAQTQGYFSINDNTAVPAASRFMINSSGNVGIGTLTPSDKLDVNGSIRLSQDLVLSNTAGGSIQTNTNDNSDTSWLRLAGGGASNDASRGAFIDLMGNEFSAFGLNGWLILGSGNNANSAIQFQTAAVERMRITSTGNVGIGANNPTRKLSILDGTTGPIVSLSGLTTNYRGLSLRQSSTDAENWFTGANGSNNFVIRRNNSNDDLIIDSTGNVGINTAVPAYRLDVTGGAHVSGGLTVDNNITANNVTALNNINATGNVTVGGNLRLDKLYSNPGSQGYSCTGNGILGNIECSCPAGYTLLYAGAYCNDSGDRLVTNIFKDSAPETTWVARCAGGLVNYSNVMIRIMCAKTVDSQ